MIFSIWCVQYFVAVMHKVICKVTRLKWGWFLFWGCWPWGDMQKGRARFILLLLDLWDDENKVTCVPSISIVHKETNHYLTRQVNTKGNLCSVIMDRLHYGEKTCVHQLQFDTSNAQELSLLWFTCLGLHIYI